MGSDGAAVSVSNVEVEGRAMPAAHFGRKEEAREELSLSPEEAQIKAQLAVPASLLLSTCPRSEDSCRKCGRRS